MKTESLFGYIVLAALSAGLILPGCGADVASGVGTSGRAEPVGATAPAVTPEVPIRRTVTLAPYSAHPGDGTRSRTARPRHEGGPGKGFFGGVLPRATPAFFTSAGGDSLGIYKVSGDANATDSVSNQGGAIIANAHLELIFWGPEWLSLSGASQGDATTAVSRILASTYLDQMKQYGFQSADVRGITNVTTSAPATFVDNDIGDFVWGLIDQGTFPEPNDAGGDNLYVVFLPPSTTRPPGELAAHGADSDYDPFDVEWVRYAWISQGNIDFMTESFSHELTEAISDPQDPAWVMDRVLNNDGNEIGDACNNAVDFLDGILVQGYWSQQQHACVIPFMPPPTITGVMPNNGPEVGGQVVTVTGTNFDTFGSTKISFAGTPAVNVSCSSHTTCTVTTPAGYGVEYVQAAVNDFNFSGTPASEYFFGPAQPSCSATYSCQSNHTGATTVSCPAGLIGLSLQRFDGLAWQPVNNPGTIQSPPAFVDHYYPAPGTTIQYEVTATDWTGTSASPPMTVWSYDCTCYSTQVCQLPNGQQIYPSVNSPPTGAPPSTGTS